MSRFPTTAWKTIDAVKHHGETNAYSAETNRFIAAYWKPVFRFLRIRGFKNEEAEDLAQGFFLRILEKDWVQRADAARGRFRTFLLTLLNRFVSDQGAKRAPRQKVFEAEMVPISALMTSEDRRFEPPTNETPESLFMREWAYASVAVTCNRLRMWCDDQGRPDWYRVFEVTRIRVRALSERGAAEHFGITREQVRSMLRKTDAEFREQFRAEVAGQVTDAAEIDDEIRALENLL